MQAYGAAINNYVPQEGRYDWQESDAQSVLNGFILSSMLAPSRKMISRGKFKTASSAPFFGGQSKKSRALEKDLVRVAKALASERERNGDAI